MEEDFDKRRGASLEAAYTAVYLAEGLAKKTREDLEELTGLWDASFDPKYKQDWIDANLNVQQQLECLMVDILKACVHLTDRCWSVRKRSTHKNKNTT